MGDRNGWIGCWIDSDRKNTSPPVSGIHGNLGPHPLQVSLEEATGIPRLQEVRKAKLKGAGKHFTDSSQQSKRAGASSKCQLVTALRASLLRSQGTAGNLHRLHRLPATGSTR